VLKARVPLKVEVSEAGEGRSDSRIVKALDTSEATAFRTRRRLVDGGFEGILARKHPPNSTRPRILDGAAEAKLIALVYSPPPKGTLGRHIRQRYQHVDTRVPSHFQSRALQGVG
jgi:hypothetical protein